ncbi:MAG TPA: LLM class F420-dependent oxidoreductase [Candidatus Binataceae bacterium]|nr:LLM class F420-dependent oxidoreductase [Candidatus Binataceae bacterium]
MKIGLLTPFSGSNGNPGEFARIAESLGYESLWIPEHPAVPANPVTKFPGGNEIPPIYFSMADQIVALSMAAATTKNLKLATGICLVPEHNPIALANQLATLDAMSDGRLIFGIGAGWLREECDLFAVDFPKRWTQTREYVAAMRELWTHDEASFDGQYVKFPPVKCAPKPARKNGPPVVIGSLDKNALKRVAKWGDGWCPIRVTPEFMAGKLAELKRECAATGRDFARMDITVMGYIQGDRAAVQAELTRFAEAGVSRYVVGLSDFTPATMARMLERVAATFV